MKAWIIVMLALVCVPARADPATDAQVRQLEAGLDRVRLEQQAAYQNFQISQEMRRIELLEPGVLIAAGPPGSSIAPPNYDDMVRSQRERQERIEKYTADLRRMYARNLELEDQKRLLRDQLLELLQRPRD